MISQLTGLLADKGLDRVIIDVGGVGFSAAVSLQTLQALPAAGQKVSVFTYLHVREDYLGLFAFSSIEEKHVFELCISVSGIGPKLALSILSGMDVESLAQAIKSEDITRLCKIPGVGKKTAERLIIELRDKLTSGKSAVNSAIPTGGMLADVINALCNLGYRLPDAQKATEKAMTDNKDKTVADVLRASLRLLQKE